MIADNISLVRELCYIADTYNSLNRKRQAARARKRYYEHAMWVVHMHSRPDLEISEYAEEILKRYPNPKKWLEMGRRKLKMLAVKASADIAQARYEMMLWTDSHKEIKKSISKKIEFYFSYSNGGVRSIRFVSESKIDRVYLDASGEEFKRYAKEHLMLKATDDFLKE